LPFLFYFILERIKTTIKRLISSSQVSIEKASFFFSRIDLCV
jgi:hypothetical protein